MDAGGSHIFLFDRFRLDRRGGLFQCFDGAAPVPINIGSRALEMLMILVEHGGNLVLEGRDFGCRVAQDNRRRGQSFGPDIGAPESS